MKNKKEMLKMNKKAQVFTIIAIALLTLFFLSYSIYTTNTPTIKTRIITMDNFLFSLEEDFVREMYILGFRTIFLAEDQIIKTGNYIPDMNLFFKEAFFNGSVNGNSSEILNGVKYEDFIVKINDKASKINVNITISDLELSISQEDPWHVLVDFSFNLTMKDKTNLAYWEKQENVKSYVEIEGFEDPLYTISTGGKVTNKINKTIYSSFIQGSDVTNLSLHNQNQYYVASTLAPSFLDRLEGKKTGNENGIESLVYLPKLSAQGITIKDKTCVDYIYFSSDIPTAYTIAGMPSWFKLDDEHLGVYQT